jgi:hypothetical protein
MSLAVRPQARIPLDAIREAEAFARERLAVGPTLASPARHVWRAYSGTLGAAAFLDALAYVPGVTVAETKSGRAWVLGAVVVPVDPE